MNGRQLLSAISNLSQTATYFRKNGTFGIPIHCIIINDLFKYENHGCGSGFNDFVDPDSESGSMRKKNEEKNALLKLFKHFCS
jgi:hypothetical protein